MFASGASAVLVAEGDGGGSLSLALLLLRCRFASRNPCLSGTISRSGFWSFMKFYGVSWSFVEFYGALASGAGVLSDLMVFMSSWL